MLDSDQSSVANVTRVIQLALTPVFLLTAVAALLNVFSTRLGRVADRVDLLSADLQRGAADTDFLSAQLDFLRRRLLILDVAVVLATLGARQPAPLRLYCFSARCGRRMSEPCCSGFLEARSSSRLQRWVHLHSK
jgi:Protein of unknown function (DUF2721)